MTVIRNFEDLKKGFGEYLESLNQGNEQKYNTSSSDVSIFMYAKEFNEYIEQNRLDIENLLSQNTGEEGSVSVGSLSISDILNLTCKDGKVSLGDGFETENTQEENDILTGILYDLLQDETFKTAIDTDNSGDLSEDEFSEFLNAIKGYDEGLTDDENSGETISLTDIIMAAKDIALGIFGKSEEEAEPVEEEAEPEEIQQPEQAAPASAPQSSGSASGGSSGGGSSGGGVSANNINNNVDENSVEALKAELDKSEGDLSTKKGELETAKNDTTPDEKFEEYKDALAKIDEDKAEQLETYKNQIDTINQLDQQITEQTQIKEDAENAISNAETQISDIDGSIAQLQSAIDSADEDTDTSGLEAQKSALERQKAEILDEKEKAEGARDDAQDAIDELEAEKAKLPPLEEVMADLQKLEADISENHPEVQAAMDAYHEAEDAKNDKIETLNGQISELETHIQEVRGKYTEALKAENEKDTTKAINKATMKYDEAAGKKLADAAHNVRGTVGYCMGGVDDTFQAVYGSRTGCGSAYMAADILASDEGLGANFVEVEVDRSELSSLPAGAVVVWNNNANGGGSNVSQAGKIHGHISIALGDGRESSDHIQSQIVNRDATFRVFYPVS